MADQKIVIWAIIISILVIGGFFIFSGNSNSSTSVSDSGDSGVGVPNLKSVIPSDWINTELKDVNSGEIFRISDFSEPVLLESFAVWCPTCTKQQKTTKKFEEEVGDSVVSNKY